jgi:uncharacterized protein YfaS (alpha-2-macroglobulin family)
MTRRNARVAALWLAGLALLASTARAEGLKILQHAPEGDLQSTAEGQQVVVTFSRPMLALGSSQDSSDFCPIKIEPGLPGNCRWLGTSTLSYQFYQAPAPGGHYDVIIPAGTASKVTGEKLEADFKFSFNTERPNFRAAYPPDKSAWLGLKPTFYAQFSLSMSAATASRYVELREDGGQPIPLQSAEHYLKELRRLHAKGQLQELQFSSWEGSAQYLEFKPGQDLLPGKSYTLVFKKGWPALGGSGAGLPQDQELHYSTYGSFQFLGMQDIVESGCRHKLVLNFSNPLSCEDLGRYLSVSPSVKILALDPEALPESTREVDGHWELNLSRWKFKPNTQYHISLKAGMSDAFGNVLEKNEAMDWAGMAPCPSTSFEGGFGVMESYVPPRHPLDAKNTTSVPLIYASVKSSDVVSFYQKQQESSKPDLSLYKKTDWPLPVSAGTHSYIDLGKVLGPELGSFTALGLPESDGGGTWNLALDNLTELGLTAKSSPESTLIWVTRLRDAQPVEGAELEIRDASNRLLWSGKSDSQGLSRAPGWKALGAKKRVRWESPELFILASLQGRSALLSTHYHEGIEPWRFRLDDGSYNENADTSQRRSQVFTDRGVYRPGESVHFKGFLRDLKSGDWKIPQGRSDLKLEIRDNRNQVALTASAQLSEQGSFEYSFSLPANAGTGWWVLSSPKPKKLKALAEAQDDEGDGDSEEEDGGSLFAHFRVEAVKAASYEVALSGLKAWHKAGEDIKASVEGRYLAGSGMPGAQGSWSLNVRPAYFSPKGWAGWDFSLPRMEGFSDEEEDDTDDAEEDLWRGKLAGSGNFALDASSHAEISASTKGLKHCSPCQATLEVNLSSPDRQKLFVRGTSFLHQGTAYPGSKAGNDFARVGQPYGLKLVVVDPEGRTLSGRQLDLRLIREGHRNVRQVGAFGRLEWRSEEKLEEQGTWNLSSGSSPKDWTFTPKAPGRYRYILRSHDEAGQVQESGGFIYAYGQGEATWARDDSDMIELVPDKAEYQPGDTAKILVKSPFEKSEALLTVEREGVLQATVRSLGRAEALEVPVTEAMLPNVYIGVALVEGRAKNQAYGPQGEDLAKPAAKFGYLTLKVRPQDRKLKVAVSTDKEDYRPGGNVDAEIKVSDAQGKAADAEITLYAVDEGILHLTGYQTPDPFAFFYGIRPLSVATADNRLAVIGTRSFGEKGQDSGGGGALAKMSAPNQPGAEGLDLRRHFESLAFWSARLQSGPGGLAKASFKLPDNLSQFRLMAVAAADKRFGSGEAGIRVNKALALRPSLPRFARLGDSLEAGVSVQNSSSKPHKVSVEIHAPANLALDEKDPSSRTLSLAPGEAKECRWKLKALSLGPAQLEFMARGGEGWNEGDALQWSLPVENPEKAEHAASSGVVDDKASLEALSRPAGAQAGSSRLAAQFSSTAMLSLRGGIQYLLLYPHLCLEQRLSRILPVVVGRDLLDAFHLAPSAEAAKAAQKVLDELGQFQDGSGGLRYWPESGDEKPDAWLTAYALEVASLAGQSGFKTDQAVLQRAAQWLKSNYASRPDQAFSYYDEERDAVAAWSLYSLSRYGERLPGLYSQLYSRRGQLPLYAQAELLRVAGIYGKPDDAKELAQTLLNQAKSDPRTLHFEERHPDHLEMIHGSSVAITGLCMEALLATQGGFENDFKAARWLSEVRNKEGAWGDTQSNAWALMGLARYFRVKEKDNPSFEASLIGPGASDSWNASFQGRSLESQSKNFAEAELFPLGQGSQFNISKKGQGRLYYSLDLSWLPGLPEKPASQGFSLQRSLTGLNGEAVQLPLQAGQRYLITLKVRSEQDRYFVALSDFLPAGLEIVDSSLATESQSLPGRQGAESWYGSFRHHENYDDRVQVYADFLSRGEHSWSYVVQASSPGSFRHPSAWVEMMYEPEVFGRSTGEILEVAEPKVP